MTGSVKNDDANLWLKILKMEMEYNNQTKYVYQMKIIKTKANWQVLKYFAQILTEHIHERNHSSNWLIF